MKRTFGKITAEINQHGLVFLTDTVDGKNYVPCDSLENMVQATSDLCNWLREQAQERGIALTVPLGARPLPGWTLPPAPVCDHCGATAVATAHHTGDGWTHGWGCECGYYEGVNHAEIEWPFVEDYARGSDWERAGFTVV